MSDIGYANQYLVMTPRPLVKADGKIDMIPVAAFPVMDMAVAYVIQSKLQIFMIVLQVVLKAQGIGIVQGQGDLTTANNLSG